MLPFPAGLAGVGQVCEARQLTGGDIHATWLVTRQDGSQVVVKTTAGVPPQLFAAEAEGLAAIAASRSTSARRQRHAPGDGGVRTQTARRCTAAGVLGAGRTSAGRNASIARG